MPPLDPFETMEPDDYEATPRRLWVRVAALVCLVAMLLLIVTSIG